MMMAAAEPSCFSMCFPPGMTGPRAESGPHAPRPGRVQDPCQYRAITGNSARRGGARIRDGGDDMAMHKDPVCGMTVDDQRAKGQSDFGGRTFYFCAKSCKDRFDAN